MLYVCARFTQQPKNNLQCFVACPRKSSQSTLEGLPGHPRFIYNGRSPANTYLGHYATSIVRRTLPASRDYESAHALASILRDYIFEYLDVIAPRHQITHYSLRMYSANSFAQMMSKSRNARSSSTTSQSLLSNPIGWQ
jgi:hypothetical protein